MLAILLHPPHRMYFAQCVRLPPGEVNHLSLLLQGINHSDLYEEDLQMHFVNAFIVIAARNIAKIKPANLKVNADKRIQDIITYIQNNIFLPQKLKASVIAGGFWYFRYLSRYLFQEPMW